VQKWKSELHVFNILFSAMGLLLLGVAGWIATSVAHIPSIEQKLDDFMITANQVLVDHEGRLRKLENNK
jgi:hypothetical protein